MARSLSSQLSAGEKVALVYHFCACRRELFVLNPVRDTPAQITNVA